jgi:hypothetical protein
MDLHFAGKKNYGQYFYKDISKYKLDIFISEYDYFYAEDFQDFRHNDIISHYKRLTEIVLRARQELTYEDFEKFCKTFGMERDSRERARMFRIFSAFGIGEFNNF